MTLTHLFVLFFLVFSDINEKKEVVDIMNIFLRDEK